MKRRTFLKRTAGAGLAVSALLNSGLYAAVPSDPDRDSEIGKPLSKWRAGDMEIHCIYTGFAESVFYILPDGTSMLLDSGHLDRPGYELKCISLPDESREPGEWIARYITRVNPYGDEVDYMMISHFHADHMGCLIANSGETSGRGDDYVLSGMTRTGETIHFKKGFDRGYPDYSKPLPVDDPIVDNFRKFIKWKEKEDGFEMIPFTVGALDQITLTKDPDKYRETFHIRNLFGNGVLWTGKENELYEDPALYFAKKDRLNENSLSLGIRFEYGSFRSYTGGDYNGEFKDQEGNKKNLEAWIGPVCGKVDVCKSNHHSYIGSMNPEFLKEVQPRVFLTNVWDQLHIQPSTMENMASRELWPDDRLICPTNFPPSKQEEFKGAPWRSSVVESGGHVVVRITNGGACYKVYYIDATDERGIVKSVYGPFTSKRAA